MLTHGSLFTGVGGFDLGFARAGIETKWMVEWDAACQSVLRHRFPGVPLYGDIAEVDPANLERVDVISFGSPCQGLSVAGLQRGLEDDERSNLFYEAVRIIQGVRPAVAVWENVPGAFSSAKGDDFASVLDALADIGALDIGWRVLDSRFFGVPQRRRRILLVADFRAERSEQILALGEGVRRHTPTRRKAKEKPAADAEASTDQRGIPLTAGSLVDSGGQRGWSSSVDHLNFIPEVAGTLGNPGGGGLRQDLDGMTYIPEVADTLRSMSDSPAPHNKVNGTDRGTLIPEVALFQDSEYGSAEYEDAGSLRAGRIPEHQMAIEPAAYQCHGTNVGPMGTLREGDGGLTSGVPFTVAFYHTNRQPEFGNRYDETPTLKTSSAEGGVPPAVAFLQSAGETMSPTVTSGGQGHSPNQVAVAFAMRGREGGNMPEVQDDGLIPAIRGASGGSTQTHVATAFIERTRKDGVNVESQDDLAYALTNPGEGGRPTARQLVDPQMRVRRLTPMECERLQGFPDLWTLVPDKKGKPMPDSQRYRQMGNAVTVNVAEWLGRRIVEACE